MNIKQLWKSLFKKGNSDETPAAAQVWQPLVGSNMPSAFAEIPEVYQSILFISTNATQAELGYFRFKDNAEVYRDNPQVRPLSELLDRPNPEMDLNTFLEFVYGFLAYHREVFILKVKSRGQLAGTRNLPAQLWPVNPKDCAAASFDAWGVSAWSIKGVIYPAEDVIHIRYFNPVDMFRSVSPLTPLAELIKANKAAMKSNRAFYENNSQTPFILATERDLTKTQMDAIKDAWEAGHKGSEKRGNTGFLSGGLKPYSINTNNGTAEFVENSKNTSERILSGLQMQKALLNMTDTTNYATYMGQLRTFWQNVIRPMVRKVESALNMSVVRPFASELELRFKYDNVEAFQADFADKVNTAKTLASIGYPINKISDRLNLGFEPVAWGDDWWINFGLVPASDYRAGLTAETDDTKACTCTHTKSTQELRKETVWKRFDRTQIRTEMLMAQKMGRFFLEQGSRLKRAAKDGTLNAYDWGAEDKALEKRFFPVVADAVRVGIGFGREQLQKSVKAETEEAAERRYLGKVAQRLTGINRTTRAKVEDILTQSLADGQSNEDLAEKLAAEVLGGFKMRARNIARTESTGALNGGTVEYAAELGAAKTWLTARDSEVRESHAELDGETRAANEVFSNGLSHPGDPSVINAGEVCNCRCTILLNYK